jgi:uncharacterized protein (DUF2267 family)
MDRKRFVQLVAERGGLTEEPVAERAARATLQTLAERIDRGEASDLAAQLPTGLADALETATNREPFARDEFVRRVGERSGLDEQAAHKVVQAVFAATAEAVAPGEYDEVVGQLPAGYAPLLSMAGGARGAGS